jgi:ectoine hydroxylase-related dioxygenase (phytanoyl-CoA dioxygenase family)
VDGVLFCGFSKPVQIYRAFAQLLGMDELWVSIDRMSFKPPALKEGSGWNHGGFLHWDRDVWSDDRPLQLQGVLALVDTDHTMGGFHCVPGSHRKIDVVRKKIPIPPSASEKFHATGIPVNVPASIGWVEKPVPMKVWPFIVLSFC